MDILSELERELANTPETAAAMRPLPRRMVVTAVTEIKRLRQLNAGLVRQLNGFSFQSPQEIEATE
jgi:hypothetical protein